MSLYSDDLSGYSRILGDTNTPNGKMTLAIGYQFNSRTETTAYFTIYFAWRININFADSWGATFQLTGSGFNTQWGSTIYSGSAGDGAMFGKNLTVTGLSANTTSIAISQFYFDIPTTSKPGYTLSTYPGGYLNLPAYSGGTSYDPTPVYPDYPSYDPTPTYDPITLTTTGTTKDSVTVKASGIPTRTALTINWYLDGVIVATDTKSSYNTSSEATHTFTGLTPSTTYTLRAVTSLSQSASASATTSQETGTLSLQSTSRAVIATLSGMGSSPSYPRSVTFRIASDDTGYTATYTYNNVTATSLNHSFEGLSINTNFTVAVTIKNGATTLLSLSGTKRTTDDYDAIPTATITGIKQVPQSTDLDVTWITDKNASGTIYRVKLYKDGEWTTALTLTKKTSPARVEVELPSGTASENVKVKIEASNAYLSPTTTSSDEVEAEVVGAFSWTSNKVTGEPLAISAEEWNRLATYVEKKSVFYGLSIEVTRVTAGAPISAAIFNEMKNAISQMIGINMADKKPGNPIKAADINALRTAINQA